MNTSTAYLPRRDYWNRMVIRILWVAFFITMLCQWTLYPILNHYYSVFNPQAYIWNHILTPDAMLFVILAALTVINHLKHRLTELCLILGVHLIAMILVSNITPKIVLAPIMMIVPMLISMLFVNRIYLYLSASICAVYLLFVCSFTERMADASIGEFFVMAGTFGMTALSAFGTNLRGWELMQSLQKSMQSEQDLLIRNIMMDRVSKNDPLTDLYNHKTFHEYLEKLIEHQSTTPFPFQLAVMDIDNFKMVNDTYGHAVGDIVLKSVSSCIKARLESDDFAARYGGEEFVVLLTYPDSSQAHAAVERIREAIAATPIAEMDALSVTVSVGLHDYGSGESKQEAFQLADSALYEAKKTGKNKTVYK